MYKRTDKTEDFDVKDEGSILTFDTHGFFKNLNSIDAHKLEKKKIIGLVHHG